MTVLTDWIIHMVHTTFFFSTTTDHQPAKGSAQKKDRDHQRRFLRSVVSNLVLARKAGEEDAFYEKLFALWFERWPEPDENQAHAMKEHSKYIHRDMHWIFWSMPSKDKWRVIPLFGVRMWEGSMAVPMTEEEFTEWLSAQVNRMVDFSHSLASSDRKALAAHRHHRRIDNDPDFPPAM
ncbi:hypothetical protein BD779DRAFT_1483178 [Infundibulicybe gibba]|nr:hypothetical protein BD779DRAFT_1483178 [Infundibulicybe gibba]